MLAAQDELQSALGQSLSSVDESEVEAELEGMESAMIALEESQMPKAPEVRPEVEPTRFVLDAAKSVACLCTSHRLQAKPYVWSCMCLTECVRGKSFDADCTRPPPQ